MARAVDSTAGRPNPAAASGPDDPPVALPRLHILRLTSFALVGLLVVGLGYVQLDCAGYYTTRAQRQSVRRVLTPPPRGLIYDRKHRLLVGNRVRVAAVLDLGALPESHLLEPPFRPSLTLSPPPGGTVSARLAAVQQQLDRLNALTGRKERLDPVRLERAFAHERVAPFVLLNDLTGDESKRLLAGLSASDPVKLARSAVRWYPNGSAASQVLGRVRPEQKNGRTQPGVSPASFTAAVGESGIEKQAEAQLQGRPEETVVQLDAWGFPAGMPLSHRAAQPGTDVVLSLDLDLQLVAERALADTPGHPRGAAVALSVRTGEVLAMASLPGFDPNLLSGSVAPATKQKIDEDGAWLNRATQGLYPPGSTFKIFTLLAGLRGGTLHPNDVLHCDGYLEVAGHRFPCHHAAGHGDLTLRGALAYSCNVFAYRTALAAGADAVGAEARRFHLDEPTGIDLPSETHHMFVPNPQKPGAAGGVAWSPGDTANLAIGQGALRYSPLQAACAIASLARGETLTVPTLFYQPRRSPTGTRPPEPLGLAPEDQAALIGGLREVIRTGIGVAAQVPGVTIAGKSGTAQIKRKEGTTDVAWFVAFAPMERPEIAIAVALEGDQPGVEFAGAEYAAPVVREIAATYFEQRNPR